jgi:predicted enzyme related to lactoylglutathione lyase
MSAPERLIVPLLDDRYSYQRRHSNKESCRSEASWERNVQPVPDALSPLLSRLPGLHRDGVYERLSTHESLEDSMARITGVGGVFLRSKDHKALAKWYSEHLGITLNGGYAAFRWSDEGPAGSGMTTWSAFPADTKYFGDGLQATMINYRVDDLDALLAQLAAAGVWIDPKREDASYGRFAWIKDCDGNRLELWQPLAD